MSAASSEWIESVAQSTSHTDDAPAGPQDPPHVRERGGRVGHVLQDLHTERGIEAAVLHGQVRRLGLAQLDVCTAGTATLRQREHRRARVEPEDDPRFPDLLSQLDTEEPGPAADVHDAFTRYGAESLPHEAAPPDRVADPIERLELLRDVLVEDELTHVGSPGLVPLAQGPRRQPADPSMSSKASGRPAGHRAPSARSPDATQPTASCQPAPRGPERVVPRDDPHTHARPRELSSRFQTAEWIER